MTAKEIGAASIHVSEDSAPFGPTPRSTGAGGEDTSMLEPVTCSPHGASDTPAILVPPFEGPMPPIGGLPTSMKRPSGFQHLFR